MAGLSDMEELISTVPERHIANFLQEALCCYGAGAYRACVVLSHIALFDGLREKLIALAPVNSTAKSIVDHIEPLASAQKVFELPLIHQMRSAAIISQLESDILEQLNRQRNKAAHPSGHKVTAEEARFVFSEVIKKFLSQPIRQTSVIVEKILTKLPDSNFFPSHNLPEIKLIVRQEMELLDKAAIPALLSKLGKEIDGQEAQAKRNARFFVLGLLSLKDQEVRGLVIKYIVDQLCANKDNYEFITEVTTCDPRMLSEFGSATKLRCIPLYIKNAEVNSVHGTFTQLSNPAHLLGAALHELGEDFMLSEYQSFTRAVMEQVPTTPQFIRFIRNSPKLLSQLQGSYISRAGAQEWKISNSFSEALPGIDGALSQVVSDEWAFRLIVAVALGAYYGGFEPLALTRRKFSNVPELKKKAVDFVENAPDTASNIIKEARKFSNLQVFRGDFLS